MGGPNSEGDQVLCKLCEDPVCCRYGHDNEDKFSPGIMSGRLFLLRNDVITFSFPVSRSFQLFSHGLGREHRRQQGPHAVRDDLKILH